MAAALFINIGFKMAAKAEADDITVKKKFAVSFLYDLYLSLTA